MVLHMVCTLGDRNLRLQDSLSSPETQSQPFTALEHYAAAPSHLAACTQNTPAPADLENILGALWLMIVYEQKHGNGCGPDLLAHLRGAASLLQDHLQNLRLTLQYNRHESSQFLFNEPPQYLTAGMRSGHTSSVNMQPTSSYQKRGDAVRHIHS